jgi:hypothetical protein
MSARQRDEDATRAPGDEDAGGAEVELDDVDIKDLLRKALDPPDEGPESSIVVGVQKRIRDRSRGRFYADGWSTTPAPRATFLVTSLVMLAVAVLAWFLLGPMDIAIGR